MTQKLMSARQAAEALGVSKAYVCRLFSQGVIPAEKVDTDWIVERKNVQRYLDDKSGTPIYYRCTDGWSKEDFYLLYRWIDKMVNDRKGRFNQELASIEPGKLNEVAGALLKAEGACARFDNLRSLVNHPPLTPPIVISTYPCPGAFPTFEEMGVFL